MFKRLRAAVSRLRKPKKPSAEVMFLRKYMQESISVEDWNQRMNAVKKKNGGDFPAHWHEAILAPNPEHPTGLSVAREMEEHFIAEWV